MNCLLPFSASENKPGVATQLLQTSFWLPALTLPVSQVLFHQWNSVAQKSSRRDNPKQSIYQM